MRPLYHEIDNQLEFFTKTNSSLPPHLHKYLECIYVTEGTLQLEIGTDWFRMGAQDLAVIFPDIIHQFHVEGHAPSQAAYLLGTPALAGSFAGTLRRYYPRNPVIRREQVHPDIHYALDTLLRSKQDPCYFGLLQAYFQVLLARVIPVCRLAEKKELEFSDLAWQAASYISEHFMEDISLSGIAGQLCISPYKLSRIFSGIFHINFNQYLNEIRLDYASHLLRTTGQPVTDIMISSGFSSQTTFNRTFKAKYRISPREYRSQNQAPGSQAMPSAPPAGQKPQKAADGSPWRPVMGRFL